MKVAKYRSWNEHAEKGLCDVLGEDRDGIIEGVNEGRLELWELEGSTWMVTCVESNTQELIVCCLQGSGLRAVSDMLWRTMKQQGLRRARWFTKRPELASALKRAGYPVNLLGYVYTVEVPNVSQ